MGKGLSKPKIYSVNRAANKNVTKKRTIFYKLTEGTHRVRVIPPLNEDGMLFWRQVNHYGIKNEDGFGIAPACLEEHGERGQDCYLCRLTNYLYSTGDKGEEKIAKDIKPSSKWLLQAFCWDGEKYDGPFFVGLSKTTADQVNDIMDQQEALGDPFFCDPDGGVDLVITRRGQGFDTRYTVNPGNKQTKLEALVPGWEDQVFRDTVAKVDPRMMTNEQMRDALVTCYGDALDWEIIDKEVPVNA